MEPMQPQAPLSIEKPQIQPRRYGAKLALLCAFFIVGLGIAAVLWWNGWANMGGNDFAAVTSGVYQYGKDMQRSKIDTAGYSVASSQVTGTSKVVEIKDYAGLTAASGYISSNPKLSSAFKSVRTWPTGVSATLFIDGSNKVQTVEVTNAQCSRTYQANASGELPLPEIDLTIPSPFEQGGKNGICGLVSTAQSIVKTYNPPVGEYSDDGGKTFKKPFLAELAKNSGAAKDQYGYTLNQMANMHQSYKTKDGQTFKCQKIDPLLPLEESCTEVNKSLASKADCSVLLRDEDVGNGHIMNVTSAKWNPQKKKCEIESTNTSDQGEDGEGVPAKQDPKKAVKFGVGNNTGEDRYENPLKIDGLSAKYNSMTFMCCEKVAAPATPEAKAGASKTGGR